MTSHCQFYYYKSKEVIFLSFKIIRKNCCGLDVHKTWIFACIGITDSNGRTEYKQARFSSFAKGLQVLCDWLVKYNCNDICMESTGKYWIPVFNILEKITCGLLFLTRNTRNPRKVTRLTVKMPNGSVTYTCAAWLSLPLSHLLIFVSCVI